MSFLEWNDSYALGVQAMDSQHRSLIDSMNALHSRSAAGAGGEEVLRLVDSLVGLTQRHFAAEERHMESIGYAGLASHRQIHTSLLKKLSEHRVAIARDGRPDDQFFAFLKLWLTSHIQGIDTKYANHGAATGATR